MLYLILCILSSTGIFIVFKLIDRQAISPLPAILINYFTASILGFLAFDTDKPELGSLLSLPWIPISILIGFLFIVMFFVVAISSKEAGLTITTVASKISVVFPVLFSILIEPDDILTLLKGSALIAAVAGVFLTIYTPGQLSTQKNRWIIPLILFVGMGIVDSLVKYAQHCFIANEDRAIFSAVLFAMAFLTGLLVLPFRRKQLKEFGKGKTWFFGILLGIVNFGSIFLLLSALNHVNSYGKHIDSSLIFGANNVGIVSLSVLAGLLLFKEKLHRINWLGIGISGAALLLFALA
ncbi:hypothetical protein ACFLT1_07690 [Bacteroidota bacterium]